MFRRQRLFGHGRTSLFGWSSGLDEALPDGSDPPGTGRAWRDAEVRLALLGGQAQWLPRGAPGTPWERPEKGAGRHSKTVLDGAFDWIC